MFSASTVSSLNERIGDFSAQTGKEIVVMTVPSLGNATLQDAANTAFSQQSVNGVLISSRATTAATSSYPIAPACKRAGSRPTC